MDEKRRAGILKDFSKTIQAQALVEYLDEEIEKLDTAKGGKTIEEYWAREKAVDILNKILKVVLKQEEKSKLTANQYR